jgi:hypothetical protein
LTRSFQVVKKWKRKIAARFHHSLLTIMTMMVSVTSTLLLTLCVALLPDTAIAFLLPAELQESHGWMPYSRIFPSSAASRSSNGNDGSRSIGTTLPLDMGQEFKRFNPTRIQGGGTLKTWSYRNPAINHVQVLLRTAGRPLEADIQLWAGPDNTPHKMKVYLEDGDERTFHTLIPTPNGPNSIKVRNTGMLEFPFDAVVEPDMPSTADGGYHHQAHVFETANMPLETLQGGAIRTYPFPVNVNSVIVVVKNSNARPLNARIELLQGPNNNKQVVEFYTEDGNMRPFYAILALPGSGNVVRVVNTSPMEFPLQASVAAYSVDENNAVADPWASDGLVQGGGISSMGGGPMKW